MNYGKCPCGGVYERREVKVTLTVSGERVVLDRVPQGACPSCGSRVYKAEVLERIESLMKRPLAPAVAGVHHDP